MSESRNVRIVTFILERVLEIESDGKKDGKCSFSGHVGDFLTTVIDPTRKYTNCTVDRVDKMGSLNKSTGMYDGAIGMVQNGEADMVSIPVYYPLYDPENEYFDYTGALKEDDMMIVCTYRTVMNGSITDVLNMFTSAPVELWWATLAGFLTFVLALNIGYSVLKIRHKYKSPLWMVTCAFLSEDNFPDDILYNQIITVTACVFLFFFGNYLMNSMSSDLIVFEKPEVIASYQDIIDRAKSGRNISVIFPPGLPETQVFADSEDPIMKAIYKLQFPLSFSRPLAEMVMALVDPILTQASVAILREVAIKGVTASGFKWADQFFPERMINLNVLLSKDPSGRKYTNVQVFSKGLDSISKGQIIKMAKRMQEAGLHEFAFESIPMKMGEAKGFMALMKKASSQIQTVPVGLPEIGFENTRKMFNVIGILLIISSLILVAENLIERSKFNFIKNLFQSIQRFKNRKTKNRLTRRVGSVKKIQQA